MSLLLIDRNDRNRLTVCVQCLQDDNQVDPIYPIATDNHAVTQCPYLARMSRDSIVNSSHFVIRLHSSQKDRKVKVAIFEVAVMCSIVWRRVSDLSGRRRLRSSSTLELFVPSYRLTVAAAIA